MTEYLAALRLDPFFLTACAPGIGEGIGETYGAWAAQDMAAAGRPAKVIS